MEQPPIRFINIEYFFQLIYSFFTGAGGSFEGSAGAGGSIVTVASGIWLVFTIFAFLFSLAALGVLVYSTMRLYQIRESEKDQYDTVSPQESHQAVEHSRWQYILQLIESGQESDWRQAIIESDIMLDEMLSRIGYRGDTIGEKLRAVNPQNFLTIQNAWEAHKVRNEIAHQGSSYHLSEHLAHRTIAHYEAVFREHGEI